MDIMSQKATYCQAYYQAYLERASYIVCGKGHGFTGCGKSQF